jgi:hypothetical protein
MIRASRRRRPGSAAIWVLVVLAFVSTMSLTAVGRFGNARHALDAYTHRTQAEWLARSGVELAAARLLAGPDGYAGETVKPLPRSEVRIVVRKDLTERDVYRVECEARYPTDVTGVVVRSVSRSLKRVDGPKGARIELVQLPP